MERLIAAAVLNAGCPVVPGATALTRTPQEEAGSHAGCHDQAFAENGALVAALDSGGVAPVPAARQAAVIPRTKVAPLLSGSGRRARGQPMHRGHSLTPRSRP